MTDLPTINPTKPTPGGNVGGWGQILNALDDAQTAAINAGAAKVNAMLAGADPSADSFAELATMIAANGAAIAQLQQSAGGGSGAAAKTVGAVVTS